MQEGSRATLLLRRIAAWSLAWVFAGALYFLLIDTPSEPELLVGAGAAALAATAFELARGQRIADVTFQRSWLRRIYRPFVRVPSDLAFVALAAIQQLSRRESSTGVFRSAPFRRGEQERIETGRRALAESLGSLAPNTIIVGVDEERALILAHQLRPSGGADAIDLLGLG